MVTTRKHTSAYSLSLTNKETKTTLCLLPVPNKDFSTAVYLICNCAHLAEENYLSYSQGLSSACTPLIESQKKTHLILEIFIFLNKNSKILNWYTQVNSI